MDLPEATRPGGAATVKERIWEFLAVTRYTRSLRWTFPAMRVKIASVVRRRAAQGDGAARRVLATGAAASAMWSVMAHPSTPALSKTSRR